MLSYWETGCPPDDWVLGLHREPGGRAFEVWARTVCTRGPPQLTREAQGHPELLLLLRVRFNHWFAGKATDASISRGMHVYGATSSDTVAEHDQPGRLLFLTEKIDAISAVSQQEFRHWGWRNWRPTRTQQLHLPLHFFFLTWPGDPFVHWWYGH